ncbi:MAG: ATP-binding protein [Comamonadaceae bacterium]|nr:MAG: ATP-binding protein [Comamonadaceae bacterium]
MPGSTAAAAGSQNEGLIDSIGDDIREIRRLAAESNLKRPVITVKDGLTSWDTAFLGEFLPIIRHAFSNIVDHGFVRPLSKGRITADRPFEISIKASLLDTQTLEILIDDTGAGFHAPDIESVAKKQGVKDPQKLPRNELLAVLLNDGASTADAVSETSGRGVGLSAIAAFAREKKGIIELLDNPETVGARIRIRFNKKATNFGA